MGCSEREGPTYLKQDKRHAQMRAKFSKKAPIKTITTKRVFERVQSYLVNMSENAVEHNGVQYRCILTANDVF